MCILFVEKSITVNVISVLLYTAVNGCMYEPHERYQVYISFFSLYYLPSDNVKGIIQNQLTTMLLEIDYNHAVTLTLTNSAKGPRA